MLNKIFILMSNDFWVNTWRSWVFSSCLWVRNGGKDLGSLSKTNDLLDPDLTETYQLCTSRWNSQNWFWNLIGVRILWDFWWTKKLKPSKPESIKCAVMKIYLQTRNFCYQKDLWPCNRKSWDIIFLVPDEF